jgi:preprotein translocase subunit SecE
VHRKKELEMNKVIAFIKESIDELITKVSWSKYTELQSSSVLVLVASVIFALFIGAVDYLFSNGVRIIYENL